MWLFGLEWINKKQISNNKHCTEKNESYGGPLKSRLHNQESHESGLLTDAQCVELLPKYAGQGPKLTF